MPEQLEEKLDELTSAIADGFEMVERRFDAVDNRFVKIDNTTEYIKNEVGKVALRLGDLRQTLVNIGVLSK